MLTRGSGHRQGPQAAAQAALSPRVAKASRTFSEGAGAGRRPARGAPCASPGPVLACSACCLWFRFSRAGSGSPGVCCQGAHLPSDSRPAWCSVPRLPGGGGGPFGCDLAAGRRNQAVVPVPQPVSAKCGGGQDSEQELRRAGGLGPGRPESAAPKALVPGRNPPVYWSTPATQTPQGRAYLLFCN